MKDGMDVMDVCMRSDIIYTNKYMFINTFFVFFPLHNWPGPHAKELHSVTPCHILLQEEGSSPSMAPSSTGRSSPTPTQMLCSTAHAVTTCTSKRFRETNRNVNVNSCVIIRLIHKSFFTITMYNKKVKQTNMDNYEITYTFGTNSLCTSSASKKMHLKRVFIIPKARSTIERARE